MTHLFASQKFSFPKEFYLTKKTNQNNSIN